MLSFKPFVSKQNILYYVSLRGMTAPWKYYSLLAYSNKADGSFSTTGSQ